jgi:HSP20 family protein
MHGSFDRTDMLSSVRSRLYRLLDEFAAAPVGPGGGAAPAVDIEAGPDEVVISAEVPGLARDELDVRVAGATITISGRPRRGEGAEERLLRAERPRARFERSFALPWALDPGRVDARLERGVLTVTVSRAVASVPVGGGKEG